MKRILTINQGKTENLGDKAINIILRDILNSNKCIVDSVGLSQTTDQYMDSMVISYKRRFFSYIKKYIPSFFIWLLKYRKKIRNEFNDTVINNKYDLVIIGGGQLIKTKCVFIYALLTWYILLRKYLNCPIIMVGVGVDNNYSFLEKEIYKRLLSKLDYIYVRDNNSKQILYNEFNISARYIPDVVFSYSKFYPNKEVREKNKLLVMIYDYEALKRNFGTSLTVENYYDEWTKLIKENMKPNVEVVLGYTTIGDKIETFKFADYLSKNSQIEFEIKDTDSLESFTEILKISENIITARMHAMILGLNFGCNIVPYIVSSKIKTFNDEYINNEINIDEIRINIEKKIGEILNQTINVH